jgi:hypothetical protein
MKTLQHFQNGTPPKKGAKVSEVLIMNMGDAKRVRVSTAAAVPGDFQHCLTIGRHAPPPTKLVTLRTLMASTVLSLLMVILHTLKAAAHNQERALNLSILNRPLPLAWCSALATVSSKSCSWLRCPGRKRLKPGTRIQEQNAQNRRSQEGVYLPIFPKPASTGETLMVLINFILQTTTNSVHRLSGDYRFQSCEKAKAWGRGCGPGIFRHS